MSVNELTDEDKANCELIGKSVADIIRFSLDDEFRKSTFQLFGVSSTKDTENEITKRLMSMIQNQNATVSKKKCENFPKDKENEQEQEQEQDSETSEAKEMDDSSETSTDNDSQNKSKRNWLQMSSQRYINSAKRRKLNFFSQPQLNQPYEREFEFPKQYTHSSNSQPVPQPSSSSLSITDPPINRAMSFSSEPFGDGLNFCRQRFKESFQNNACKYLKRNSKSQSQKHLS